jgi:hypothetical protein
MFAFASCGHEYMRGYVDVMCPMWRDVIQREEKLFLAKKQKSKERKSKDRKKRSKLSGNLAPAKNGSRKQRRCKPFNPRCAVEECPAVPLTEIPGSCRTLDVLRYISPLMRPPYMKRLSPLFPDGPTFF